MVKEKLLQDLKQAVKDLGLPPTDIVCDISKNPAFGDYNTNMALQLAKLEPSKDKQSALEIANQILEKLGKPDYLEKAEVAGGGFINFFITDQALLENLYQVGELVNSDQPLFAGKESKGKKIMVEFAHPNTHKAFHIGHLRNISTGESLVRLLQAVGYQVIRANYEGDVGMHIAKAIYALLHIAPFKDDVEKITGVHERVDLLGKAYAAGSQAFEEDDQAQKLIKDFNFLVYASAQRFQQEKEVKPSSTDYMKFVEGRTEEVDQVFELWKKTRQWSLDYFETIYQRVSTHFDRYYFESECLSGVDEAKEALKKGILKESDGAVIFPGEKYGLDTRVFVNKMGLPTYEGKELALAKIQFSEHGHLDKLIHVLGPEQVSFTRVTFKVEELLDIQKGQQYHLAYGWVRLKEGKMSSRLGQVILGEWLLDEAKAEIKKQFQDMDEETLEVVAVGAVKFSMLKFATTSEISFSFQDSISLEGDSGPYLQYAYARAKSVLSSARYDYESPQLQHQLEEEERYLLKQIEYFEEVVEKSAKDYAPHLLAEYLLLLAKNFNLFYQKHRIINAEEKTAFRLALTAGVASILRHGLYLLGIKVPERM